MRNVGVACNRGVGLCRKRARCVGNVVQLSSGDRIFPPLVSVGNPSPHYTYM